MVSRKHTVALAVGVFDIFHIGHLKHLQQARTMADVLVVGVTRDEHVNKGPGRPVFTASQRADILRALAIVDRVLLCDGSYDALQQVRPDYFVLGREYMSNVAPDDATYCKADGVLIRFTDGPVFSSTKLLHHYDRIAAG